MIEICTNFIILVGMYIYREKKCKLYYKEKQLNNRNYE